MAPSLTLNEVSAGITQALALRDQYLAGNPGAVVHSWHCRCRGSVVVEALYVSEPYGDEKLVYTANDRSGEPWTLFLWPDAVEVAYYYVTPRGAALNLNGDSTELPPHCRGTVNCLSTAKCRCKQ